MAPCPVPMADLFYSNSHTLLNLLLPRADKIGHLCVCVGGKKGKKARGENALQSLQLTGTVSKVNPEERRALKGSEESWRSVRKLLTYSRDPLLCSPSLGVAALVKGHTLGFPRRDL